MNITTYIKKNNIPHRITGSEMHQVCNLEIKNKGITSLKGFVQNGELDLRDNKIKNLRGFKQSRYLDIRGNPINTIKGADTSLNIHICRWMFVQKGEMLTINCKTKKIKAWDKFFKKNKTYITKADSIEYKEIKRIFNLYKKNHYEL